MNPLTLEALTSAAPRQRARYRVRPLLIVLNSAALLVVALWFRTHHLANIPGINGDEAWSGVQALRLVRGEPVDWWTPHGNPINGFFILPLAALHALAPPSFVLLRIVSLASGILALALNYVLCRRAFDRRTAVVSTWLLALLPIDIAYSRFAWDASQSLLATLPVLYLPLIHYQERRSRAGLLTVATLALAAAIWVHPTNVFAAPLLAVPVLYNARRQIAAIVETTAVEAKTWTLAALAVASVAAVYGAWNWLSRSLGHFHGFAEVPRFAVNYLRLFSGATIYEFISGAGLPGSPDGWLDGLPLACDLLFGCAAIVALAGMMQRLVRRPAACDVCLVLGWFLMLPGFFLVAGPGAIAPHSERYGICLLAPGALLMARGLAWWIGAAQPRRALFATAVSAAAWLWLVSFYFGYFAMIERTGGRSHMTFRTAAVEPKLQALQSILARRQATEPTRIVCHEWWNYWPLKYLAMAQDNVQVLTWDQWQGSAGSDDRDADNTWFVEFAGTPAEAEVLDRLNAAGLKVGSEPVYDYGQHKLLSIIGPAEKFSQNY